MVSWIEQDRFCIKNNKKINYSKSYLKKEKPKITLHSLRTLNLIYFLEENICSKKITNNMDCVLVELNKRSDLFDCFIEFIKYRKVKDELYYWNPKSKISDIYSLIINAIPDFLYKFQDNFIKNLIKENIIDTTIIDVKFSENSIKFNIFKKDYELFNSKFITPDFYLDKYSKLDIKNISEDVCIFKIPELVYVEVSIENKIYFVSKREYIGLINKDKEYKEFWNKKGIIY